MILNGRDAIAHWLRLGLPLVLSASALKAAPENKVAEPAEGSEPHAATPAAETLPNPARVQQLAAEATARGVESGKAYAWAWAAVCGELHGKGRAELLLAVMEAQDDTEKVLESLTEAELEALLIAMEELGLRERTKGTSFWAAMMHHLATRLSNDSGQTAGHAEGTTSGSGSFGGSNAAALRPWVDAAWEFGKREGTLMPSVWWLRHASGTILAHEPTDPNPPPSTGGSDIIYRPAPAPSAGNTEPTTTLSFGVAAAPSAGVAAPSLGMGSGFGGGFGSAPSLSAPSGVLPPGETEEEEETEETEETPETDTAPTDTTEQEKETGEEENTPAPALMRSAAPRLRMMSFAAAPFSLEEPAPSQAIEVAAGTAESVVTDTEASSVTLWENATLYVSKILSLSGTMKVTDSSHLVVKDGGVVTLGAYQDYSSNPTENKKTALLFNALLNSTSTEGSGVVNIESVSVQFGDGSYYNLADKDGLNAVFAAHYEVAGDMQLQNYCQGASGKPSLWKIAAAGNLHVGGDFMLSSYQRLEVDGGALAVDGTTYLGHGLGSQYASMMDILSGSVTLHQVTGATAGASAITMSGGELTFKCEGDVFINPIEQVTLTGGTLIAEGNNWTLNHNASVGGVTVKTDADHAITLGAAGKIETLTGDLTLANGSHAALDGTMAGAGTVHLSEGSILTLGADFSVAAGASVGIDGSGTVQVNQEGTSAGLKDGFAESYTVSYKTGTLEIDPAAELSWRDGDNQQLEKVTYADGTLTGTIKADPGIYHFVTAGHRAEYAAGGNAEGAVAFRMHNDGKILIGEGQSVSVSQVAKNGHTLTLQGSGDYVLDGFTMPQNTLFEPAGADKWTGAVVISGSVGGKKVQSFNGLYQTGSAIAMNGFDGIPTEWYNGTLDAGIRLDAQADGSPAWRWNSGSASEVSTTFSGAWSGAGDFVLGSTESGTTWKQNFTYSGDIEAWTGRFLVERGISNVTLTGAVNQVYAELDNGTGTLNLKSDVDAVFHANATVNSLAVSGTHKITLEKGTEMHITNALPTGINMQQTLQNTYFSHVRGEGTLFLNFGSSESDQMSITKNTTVTPDVNLVFTGTGAKQELAIAMWDATSGGLNLDHTFLVADEMTLQWGAGLSVGQTTEGAGSLVLNKLNLGHWNGQNQPARVTLSGGTMMLGKIDISSAHKNTFDMTGGVLEITSSGNAVSKSTTGTDKTVFTLAGGTLRADGAKWVWNHNAVIGEKDGAALSVETLNDGAVTIGAQDITTTLANTIENHGTLTLDGTVNITMDASDMANGYIDQDDHFGMSVGFAATLQMPGAATYQVVTGNAASLGENIVWKAKGQTLNVVPAGTQNAADDSYYFDGYNLRLVNETTDADPVRTGTVYYVGGRGGDYHFDKAENAAIVTGFDIANGTLHVDVSPEHNVSLALGYGTLDMGENVAITVDKQSGWSMDAGASVVLGEGAVLTLPGVHPETKADSYKVYQLLNNASGSGTIVFNGTLDVQFGNAGHNFVSPDSYNILEDNGTAEKTGVNADIKTNVVVKGDMLLQNYRQGKDHPEKGSWWKVSEGGSLAVQGNLESSSYQKMSVEGGALTVGGTYKIGHDAGSEYEGDLELKSGSLSVGTFETVHEETSTVHVTGGKLTVTGKDKTAFANTFREVSARDAEFEGNWTWNHDAVIGNLTITAGSAITLGTAETTLTLESPLAANRGALTLDGAFIVNMERTEGGDVYGTEQAGYTADGDGYLKNLGDVYTLVKEGNAATLGKDIHFTLNGEELEAGSFDWDGKSLLLNGTEAGTVYYLNTDTGYHYTAADTRTTAFELVNAGAVLHLERELSALECIHAAAGGTVELAGGVRMDAALLQAEDTVTLTGSGTYVLNSNALMAHAEMNHVSFENPAWTGTAELRGQLGAEGTLNSLGNAQSWVEMKGVFGADGEDTLNINVKLTDENGEPAWIYTGAGHDVAFTGDWRGEGSFDFVPVGAASQEIRFSGDISGWTGAFSASGGTAQLVFESSASSIAADILQKGGKVEIAADTDTHFSGQVAATALYADHGCIVVERTVGSTLRDIRATGGDISLQGLAADTSVTLDELIIGDTHTVSAYEEGYTGSEPATPDVEAHITITGEGSQLTAGMAAGLTANLNVGSGATLRLADRGNGLRVNGALTLDSGSGITLDSAMKEDLRRTGSLVLFSGVESLMLGAEAFSAPITLKDAVDANEFFRGLMENLAAENSASNYVITYSGSAEGGVVSIRDTSVPEPSGALLSLLALASLAARRRRA